MPNYVYTVLDRAGNPSTGETAAANPGELRRLLRQKDLFLTNYRPKGRDSESKPTSTPLFVGRVSVAELGQSARQLSTMLRAGLPLHEALDILSSQAVHPRLSEAWVDIRVGVQGGQSLSDGISRHGAVFPNLMMALVQAGEAAGTLPETLELAARQFEREDGLRRKVKAAMLYPKIVLVAAVITVSVMLGVVVPVFAKVYSDLRAELPVVTRLLIEVSSFITQYGLILLAGLGLASLGLARYRRTARGRAVFDRLTLRSPVLGSLVRKVAIARFVQTLSGATRGGIGMIHGLELAAKTSGNQVIEECAMRAAERVSNGAALAPELEHSGQFPVMVTRMVGAGEASGNLVSMLDEISNFYEREIDASVDRLARVVEPVMTGLIGGIVLFVLLALYMPIFSIGEAIRGGK